MATQPDKVFVQGYEWFREAVDHVLADAPWPAADKAGVEKLVWKLIGRINVNSPLPAPNAVTLEDFQRGGAAAHGLALAALIAAEFLVALDTIKSAVDAVQAVANGGMSPAAKNDVFKLVGQVVKQVDAIVKGVDAAARYPSAFGLAKLLLTLSDDARTAFVPGQSHAQLLASFVTNATVGGNPNQAQTADAASALDGPFGWSPQTMANAVPPSALHSSRWPSAPPARPSRI